MKSQSPLYKTFSIHHLVSCLCNFKIHLLHYFIFIHSVIAVLESEESLKMEARNGETNNVNIKTKLCRNFMHGTCNLGARCNYAHGYSELRESPKLCRMFSSNGHCTFGDNCRYLHSAPHYLESAVINLTPTSRKFFYPILSRLEHCLDQVCLDTDM
jgi:hypothetical protein